MKKLSTVLLALSMLFGSDVDARRAPGVKAGKKGIQANKGGEDNQFSSENLVQKILELSDGGKSDLEALSNVAKTLSEMVEKNPGILTQVQNIVKETETVKKTIKGKGKKGKKVLVKKSAASLASALGKLISDDVDAATSENAPAKFDTLLKNSKLIAEVNKEIDLSRRFSEGLKFNSEKLVKDLNVALTEKDETKKFEALKALFASLDSQYSNLTALAPTLEVVFSEIRKAVQSSGEFNATADVEKKVNEMYLTYSSLNADDQAKYLKGIKNFSESVSSMNQAEKKDNFKSLNDNTDFDYKNLSGLSAHRQVIVTVTGDKDAGKSLNDVKALLTKKAALTAGDLKALETVSRVYGSIFDRKGDIQDAYGISKTTLDSFKTEIKDVLQSASKKVAESLTVEWAPGAFTQAEVANTSPNFATFGKVIETDAKNAVFSTQDTIGRKVSLSGTKVAKNNLLFGDGTSLVSALMGSADLTAFQGRNEVAAFLADLGTYVAPAFLADLRALLRSSSFRCTAAGAADLLGAIMANNGTINATFCANNGLGRVQRNDLVTILEMAQGKTTSRLADGVAVAAAHITNLVDPVAGNDLTNAVNAAKKVVRYFDRY